MTSHENLTLGPMPLPRIRRGRRDSRPVTSQNAVRVTSDAASGWKMTVTSADELGQTSPSSGSMRTMSSTNSNSSASINYKHNRHINTLLSTEHLLIKTYHSATFKTTTITKAFHEANNRSKTSLQAKWSFCKTTHLTLHIHRCHVWSVKVFFSAASNESPQWQRELNLDPLSASTMTYHWTTTSYTPDNTTHLIKYKHK